ncbi:molybdenum cofactor guanylyltransferase [Parafrankia discariae]|uniref:molybdenum cofactor guanylyltransferase n=1 Tax=Parafrankia discariae TaxID=365528 RepID=UPI001E2C2839|nr:NTP transferase domain-containing protein [Parafrankia discariae]
MARRVAGPGEPWDALVLAGGHSRRLGGQDKASVVVGGLRLLDRVLDATRAAERIIVVGPPRPARPGSRPVRWTREDPPGGGPVAAIAAGMRLVAAPLVVVLAVDLPFVGVAEITGLLGSLGGASPGHGAADVAVDVAVLADPAGRAQYLAAAWRAAALRAALPADPAGRSVRSLLAGREVRTVPATDQACLDCDDPASLAAARARAVPGPHGWGTMR